MKIQSCNQTGQSRAGGSQPETAGSKAAQPDGFAALAPGQLVRGRVVRVEGDGRVLLAFGKESIAARTSVPLRAGSEHWFEVRRGGAEPWLALAPGKGAAQELLRLLAAEEGIRGEALRMLLGRENRGQGAWPAPAAALLETLAGQLTFGASGSQADPAAIIFSLLLLQRPDGPESGSFRRRLAELLANLPEKAAGWREMTTLARILGLCEEINSQPAEGERFFLFPCVLAGGNGWGEWLFSMDHGGKEATGPDKACRLSFYLRLSRLGDLHLQMDIQANTVNGRIFAADEKAGNHIEGYLPELGNCLKNLGFDSVMFSCRPADRHLLQELQAELSRRAGLKPLALVDIRA